MYLIPSKDQLRTEIIDTLTSDWQLDQSLATALSHQPEFQAARRKYHYLKARGRVDQLTPGLLHVFAFEIDHFKSDEAVNAWLSEQLASDPVVPAKRRRTKRRHPVEDCDLRFRFPHLLEGHNAETRSVTTARRSRRACYSVSAQQPRQLAHAASL